MPAALSPHAVINGLLVTLVGWGASVAIVLKGLAAVGASPAEMASGLAVVCVAMGVLGIVLGRWLKMPISIAWTTPGMALLATSGGIDGGFAVAVGAFVLTGLAIVVAGLWETLGRLVAAIPRSVANAMLAGVVLKLCLAPFVALGSMPLAAGSIIVTWVVVTRFARVWAAPAAAAVALVAMWAGGGEGSAPLAFALPYPIWIPPVFDLQATISIALPLFLVTMASQNIPGYAVLNTYGYHPPFRPLLIATGAVSVLTAPFGSPTINLAAITAALCAGDDTGLERDRRWIVAVVAGVGYIAIAGLAALAVGLVTGSSPILIEAAAGLALLGALGGSLEGALADRDDRVPALLTFLTAASGLAWQGIGPAFWALVVGIAAHLFLRFRAGKQSRG